MNVPTVALANVPDPLPVGLHVLDVREQDEWDHGHIEGALHIPLSELGERVDEVPTEQTLVICKAGGRSAQATAFLAHQGRDVVNLDGGMLDWEGAQRPMVSENGQPPQVV